MANAKKDSNYIPVLLAISNADDITPIMVRADGTTRRLLVDVNSTIADDTAFTPATSVVTMAGAEFDDTTPDSVDEGDAGALRMSGRRELYVQIRDAAGNERGLKVDSNGAIAVTGGGGGTQYVEDAAHASGDTGTLALVVRKDTPANLSGTDGDYEALQVSAGRLWASATIDAALPAGTNAIGKLAANSGVDIGDVDVTSVIPGTGATNLGKAIDGASGATDTGIAPLAIRDDALGALTPIEGDYIPLRVDANGALWTHDDALDAALAGSELQVDIVAALPAGTNAIGKLAANSGVDIGDVDVTSVVPGTAAASLGKAEDAAHASGDTGVYVLAVRDDSIAAHSGTDGDYESLHTDANGALWTHPTDSVAHDAADAGNGIKITAKAETSPKGITLVADGDRTDLYADADGMLMVKLNHSNADLISERVSNTDGASTAFSNFTAVASTYNYITTISIWNSSATNGYVDFRDGTAGAILWTMPAPTVGGSILGSDKPIFRTSANTALAFDVSAALTTVYISVSGYQSKA